ncbi:MAG: D-cysteine desulfhydrase [Burkholderiaceae bacterium]
MIDLSRFPRVNLCHQPTPLEPLPRLSEQLGGPRIWIKRDDCTGLATGGNKTRKLEFLIGEALAQNAEIVVTQGAVQSNHVRQTAAAACRHGLACHALLEHRVPNTTDAYEASGNVFLDHLFGCTLEYRPAGLDMNAEAQQVVDRMNAEGRRAYMIPGGGSNETGALGYVVCAQELVAQAAERDMRIDWIVTATGSTGTHAGLVAGLYAAGADIPVMGVSVRQPRERQVAAVHRLAESTARLLGAPGLSVEAIRVDDGYIGEGYGIPAPSTIEAIRTAARTDAILLDPVYSGKGFAGLLGLARAGFFGPDDNVVFLHTGGAVALFAYENAFQ